MDEEDEGCTFSCEGEPGSLKPNADIAGLGVILSFLITAYFTVAILIAYYVCYFDPDLDPSRASGQDTATTELPNPVDRTLLFGIRRRKRPDKNTGASMEGTLNKCIVMFADIQIVTGIAILIAGYSTLTCGISAYHWQLVVDLAWFSSVTHLAALTFLRRYLHNRPLEKWCRVALMLVMLALLSVAAGPTAKFTWLLDSLREVEGLQAHPASHAICFYRASITMDREGIQSLAIIILLLVYGYAIRIAKLSPSFSITLRKYGLKCKRRSMERMEKWHPDVSTSGWKLLKPICLDPVLVAFFQVLHVQLDLFCSVFAEVYWLIVSVSWGTKKLVATRKFSPGGESSWSFGQVLPLILLAAPLVSFLESLSGQEGDESGENGRYYQRRRTNSINEVEIIQVCPQPSTETAAVDAPPSARNAESLDEHEQSPSFLGTLFLAVWFYVLITEYIMTNAPRDLTKVFSALVFELFVFQPAIQLSWPLWCLWIDKLGSSKRPWLVTGLRLLMFLALLETMTYEFYTSSADAITVLEPGIVAASLLVLYAIFLFFAVNELHTRQLEQNGVDGTALRRLRNAGLQLIVTGIVIAASFIMMLSYRYWEYPGHGWLFLICIIPILCAWMIAEAYFHKKAIKERWRTIWRTSFFLVAWAWFLLLMYTNVAPQLSLSSAFFGTVVGFGVLSLWYALISLRKWSVAKQDRAGEVELENRRGVGLE
ncbi:hypothetical protein QBC34DRAFT_404587 [Podospora aff. communis PSN243]|uniref:Transmembrane protein n=1 Tax=Podospora aff. communis PSN243 TaxID=3040156 RepID=A0AAV9GLH0_9PEZI|nr:hypothetical protein QBC34DRAFT_404587 [Podospora aff. communis PSN243]